MLTHPTAMKTYLDLLHDEQAGVDEAKRSYEDALSRRNSALKTAATAGAPSKVLEAYTGLSRERVHQIRKT